MAEKRVVSDNDRELSSRTRHTSVTDLPSAQVDHGWAWFVMLGAFLNLTFIMFFLRSMGLLFIQFLEKYQESATMTTMAFGFCSVMFALSNIFGPTYLLHRFEVRTLAVIGAVINFLSILFMAFAPNIIVIDVMMAFLGMAHGLISVPQTTLLGCYFKKRLTFATAFVTLGLSVATIAGPPLTQLLLDTYGLQGTIMILAGINMNCIPASMLLRPFSLSVQSDMNVIQANNETKQDSKDFFVNLADPEKKDVREKLYDDNDVISGEEIDSMIATISERKKPAIVRSISEFGYKAVSAVTITNDDIIQAAFVKSELSLQGSNHKEGLVSGLIDMVSVSSSIRYLSDLHMCTENSVSKYRTHYNNKQQSLDDLHMNTIMGFSNGVKSIEISVKSISNESVNQASERSPSCFTKVRQSISGSIYIHPLSILLLLAFGLGVHTQTIVAYMPAAGKDNGLTDDQIPYLVTVVGACDLVSKLVIGVFADLGYVQRIHIACACELILGTLLHFVSFFDGFGLMILLQVAIGMTVGIMHAMVAVITVDILGVQYMGHIMAGYFLVNGLITTLDHIIIGSIKDFTGSFLDSYSYIGALVLISAFLLLMKPLVARFKPLPES